MLTTHLAGLKIRLPRKTALCAWMLLAACATARQPAPPGTSVGAVASVEVFYGALAPYGEWVYLGGWGRVWRPHVAVVGAGFRPYGPGGHWVYTDYGWSFESDWSWGWAPFHYGRWYLDGGYGWVWMPGTVWAPAWVSWRYGGGYVGWAPLPPSGSAIAIETYHPYWCFVETRYLVVRDVYHYAMPVQNYHAAFSATVAIQQNVSYGGTRWSAGPPPAQVSREVGQPVHPASVSPPPPGAVQAHQMVPAGPSNTAHPAALLPGGTAHLPAAPQPGGGPHSASESPPGGAQHPAGSPPGGSPHSGAEPEEGHAGEPHHPAAEAATRHPTELGAVPHAAPSREGARAEIPPPPAGKLPPPAKKPRRR